MKSLRVAIVAGVVLLTLGYYFWTSVCSFSEVPEIRPREHRETDHYNLLTRGFLKGQLHLDGEVPQALIDAPNPYDPKSRGPIEVLHDSSYYRGKYYIYFGPAPAVTLFLPFTVLTGRDLPIPYGVLVCAAGAFLLLVGIFLFIQRRYYPAASNWTIAAALLAMGAGSLAVALLRRPNIWEMAGASGLFYFALSVFCLVRALHSIHAARWAAAGGLALGFAIASRPTYVACSLIFVVPLLFRRRGDGPASLYGWKALFTSAATCGIVVFALLGYNYARFENPFEFGQKYQLSSIIEGEARHFSLGYLVWNIRVYFFSALRWVPMFPFHDGVALPPFPAGHAGCEYSFGLFPNLPFSLFSLATLVVLFRPKNAPGTNAVQRQTIATLIGAAVLSLSLLLFYFGSCIRYMSDFVPWFMLVAAIGALEIESRLRARRARGILAVGAFTLALFSAAVAGLGVVPLYNVETGLPPPAYDRVSRWLNYPTFRLRLARPPDYRPREITLTFPADRSPRQETLTSIRRGSRVLAEFVVDFLGDQKLRFGYRDARAGKTHFSPVIAPSADRPHTLRVSFGTDYSEFDGRWLKLRLQFNDWILWHAGIVSFDTIGAEIHDGAKGTERPFTGTVLTTRRIREDNLASLRLGGARVRVALAREMAGRSFPLVSSGRTGAGDLLFLRVEPDGRSVIGYDHWADALRFSPPIASEFGQEYVLEFWTPPANAPAGENRDADLLVKVNGSIHWRQRVPWFPTTAKTLFIGENPIGGSTCETTLINSIIEEAQIPPPALPAPR